VILYHTDSLLRVRVATREGDPPPEGVVRAGRKTIRRTRLLPAGRPSPAPDLASVVGEFRTIRIVVFDERA